MYTVNCAFYRYSLSDAKKNSVMSVQNNHYYHTTRVVVRAREPSRKIPFYHPTFVFVYFCAVFVKTLQICKQDYILLFRQFDLNCLSAVKTMGFLYCRQHIQFKILKCLGWRIQYKRMETKAGTKSVIVTWCYVMRVILSTVWQVKRRSHFAKNAINAKLQALFKT